MFIVIIIVVAVVIADKTNKKGCKEKAPKL